MAKDREELRKLLQNANVRAWLHALRPGEGTDDPEGYRRLVGGGEFNSFATHPNVRRKIGDVYSTAAGAYQITFTTFKALRNIWNFTDFEPGTQDEMAVALTLGRGAIPAVLEGDIETAVRLCNKEWASLPGSPYGQPTVAMAHVIAEFQEHGGTINVASITQPAAPIVEAGRDAEPENNIAFSDVAATVGQLALGTLMPASNVAIAIAQSAIPALLKYAPDLVKIFTDKETPVSERNTAAAMKVLEIAQQATSATNAQEAIEKIDSDPVAQTAFREAVTDQWYALTESSGGGVEGARKASIDASAGGVRRLFANPSFLLTVLLLPLVYFVVVVVMTQEGWTQEMRTMVVTAVVSGVLGSLTGFWLGTSFGSQRKTDMLAQSGKGE